MLYNIIELLNYLLLSIFINYIGIIVYLPKKKLWKKQIISTVVLILLIIFVNNFFIPFYLIFFLYIIYIIFYKITYKNNIYLCLYSTFVGIIIPFTINIITTIFIKNIPLSNLLTIAFSFLALIIFRNKIRVLSYNIKNITLINYLSLNLYLIYMISKSIIEPQEVQITIFFILLTTLITILILKEQELDKLKKEIKELQKYTKLQEQVITSYSKEEHEYKNKLIIIKGMIQEKDKELQEYIEYLIEESIPIKHKWLNKLKVIPFPLIKNFINYKLNILEQNNAKIELFIGEELHKINPQKVNIIYINNINTIIGIMLDNMIESIKQTKEKLVSINIYKEKNIIHILFANNIENYLDLSKINKVGYSTKGEKRGIGLSLVNDIVSASKNLELETKIEEQFFIQHLKIKNINKYLK